jgi:hypothetical protein
MTYLTPTAHEKSEWARCAQAAYARGCNEFGHKLSAAAALPNGASLDCETFDAIASIYREWLILNVFNSLTWDA